MTLSGRWWLTLVGLTAVALVGLFLFLDSPPKWGKSLAAGHATQVPLIPPPVCETTLMGYNHAGPPPWSDGNQLTLYPYGQSVGHAGFGVVNMSAEKFGRLAGDLGLQSIEMQLLADHSVLITDRRIPRSWFRSINSRWVQPDLREQLRRDYAEWFRGD